MNTIKAVFAWLSRLGRCRGFGIQSPWAFHLVCDAVNTHRWDSLFADIEAHLPKPTKWHERRLCRLTVKLVRHYGFDEVAAGSGVPKCFSEYMRRAGVKTVAVKPVPMAVVSCSDDDAEQFEEFMTGADSRSVMLVYGIHADKNATAKWRKLQADGRTGITFDVYYAGIVFFDHHIYKQHYKIEF